MNYMEYNCLYMFKPIDERHYIRHVDNENDYCYKSTKLLVKVNYEDIVFIFNEFVWFIDIYNNKFRYIKIYNMTQNITSYIDFQHLNFFRKL